MRLNLKYLGGDFKDIPIDKTITVCKFTNGKIAFNAGGTDKNAKEYKYKNTAFNNNILEIITEIGTAKFEASEKEYNKFIKMMKQRPESKINHPVAMLIGIIIVVAVIIHFANSNSSNTNTSTNNTATNTTQKASKPVAKATPVKKDFANSDVTSSTIKDALKKAKGTNVLNVNSKKEFKNIDVMDNGNGKTVTITFKPQVGGETDLAKTMASTIVNYAEILSKNKNVDKFIVEFDEDFEDENGKDSEGLAIWMEYDKTTMGKIDYDNFKESIYGDYTRAYNIADSYKIANGIYNKLEKFGLPENK